MPDISSNIKHLLRAFGSAAEISGRNAETITLLAVSKTQPPQAVRAAFAAGQRAFGENYLQEALDKMAELADLAIEWHFIGPIQANKTRPIAEHFDWVHSVAREKIAQRLNDQRPPHLPPLNVCIQVNIDGEDSKAGVAPDEVADLALKIAQLPRLRLRGLMAIPAPQGDPQQQREAFFRLRQLLATLSAQYPQLAALGTLSMGMSGDFAAAIAEGATIVRIGTAIFGARPERVLTHNTGESF